MLNKTLLGSAAVIMTMVGAQAADLPSKKAAPATYVKICDAYGAGFFFIPGTETCIKVGGYVRAEYQYAPGHDVFTATTTAVTLTQRAEAQDTSGTELRGRVELDARTPTSYGVARTLVWLRGVNASGLRTTPAIASGYYYNNTGLGSIAQTNNYTPITSQANLTVERALVQWAGFTFGIGSENYADMPSVMYGSNFWTGYPTGMSQIAYTAVLGGGFSATLALQEAKTSGATVASATPANQVEFVANVRLDQSWGYAKLNGSLLNSSFWNDEPTKDGALGAPSTSNTSAGYNNTNLGQRSKQGWAVGATVQVNLPMLAAGAKIWFTSNYADGNIGKLMSTGSLWNGANSSAGRIAGGTYMTYSNVIVTSGATSTTSNQLVAIDSTTGWNIGTLLTHYWDAKWRSNFAASYVSLTPPTSQYAVAGKGSASTYLASLIYTPTKDFDIGLEAQYLTAKTSFNAGAAGQTALAYFNSAANTTGAKLSGNGMSYKLRVERQF